MKKRSSVLILAYTIFSLMVNSMIQFGFLRMRENGVALFNMAETSFVMFVGIMCAVFLLSIKSIKLDFSKLSSFFLTIPSFVIVHFLSRLNYEKSFGFIGYKKAPWTVPMFRETTKFMLGFCLCIIVVCIFISIKNKSISKGFQSIKWNVLCLLLPFIASYFDTIAMKLFVIYGESMLILRNNTDRMMHQIFQFDQLYFIGMVLIMGIVFWLLLKPVELSKWVKVFVIVLGVVFILKNYLMFVTIGGDRVFLNFINIFINRYGLFALLYTPMLVLAIKGGAKKSSFEVSENNK